MPYFFNINKIPDIDIDKIVYLFLFVAALAFLQMGVIIFFLVIYNYAIFKNKTKNKITKFIFVLMQFSMLIILFLPFVYEFDYLKEIVNYLLNNFNWLISAYFLLFVIYFGFGIFKNRNLKNFDNWLSLFIVISFDFLFIVFVYERHEEINPFLLFTAFCFFIIVKAFGFLKPWNYKIFFCFSLLMAILPIILLSPNFVKTINLANYEENYTIKTEFIPKIVLNLPTCFEGYSGSCIENTDTNKTKINNLLVKVKSEDRYYFKILINDVNITKHKENFANAIKYSADKNLTKASFDLNFTIKDFKKIFDKSGKEFAIDKKNIEN